MTEHVTFGGKVPDVQSQIEAGQTTGQSSGSIAL
jgi:hypothetical protein